MSSLFRSATVKSNRFWVTSLIVALIAFWLLGAVPSFAAAPDSTLTSTLTQTFPDVPPDHWAYEFVERIAWAGLTAGYPDGTYRPNNSVTRAEITVFVNKGIHGGAFTPPPIDGSHPFSDISGHWAEAWIEELYDEGILTGFPDGTYRPDAAMMRGEMAVILIGGVHGPGWTGQLQGGSFSDVAGHWAEPWIEELKELGITSGYPDGSYRPDNPVSRAEMAVFLVRAFNPYPPAP